MSKIHMLKIVVPVDGRVYKRDMPLNERQIPAFARKGKTAAYASCHEMINDKLTIYYGLVTGEDNRIGKTPPKQKNW